MKIENDTIVQVWIGPAWKKEISKVTNAGNPVLLSACWYLSDLLSGGDWKKFYYCDPLLFSGSKDQKKLMWGGEACMWGEYVDRYQYFLTELNNFFCFFKKKLNDFSNKYLLLIFCYDFLGIICIKEFGPEQVQLLNDFGVLTYNL